MLNSHKFLRKAGDRLMPLQDVDNYFFVETTEKMNRKLVNVKVKPGIAKLPDNLVIFTNLSLDETDLIELPGNFTVYGTLNLIGSKITSLPDNLCVERLYIDSDFEHIPEDFRYREIFGHPGHPPIYPSDRW